MKHARLRCPVMDCQEPPGKPHHIVSKGAGGTDDELNLLPLCFFHHREYHDKGWQTFCRNYSSLAPRIIAAREAAGKKVS